MNKNLHDIDSVRMLAERSLVGLYLAKDGKFILANANMAQYTEYKIEHLVGAKSDRLIHPDDRKRVKEEARKMLRGENQIPYVFRIVTRTGKVRWVMESVYPVLYQGDRLVLGNTMDVTDRMEA